VDEVDEVGDREGDREEEEVVAIAVFFCLETSFGEKLEKVMTRGLLGTVWEATEVDGAAVGAVGAATASAEAGEVPSCLFAVGPVKESCLSRFLD